MESNNRLRRILGILSIFFALAVFLAPEYAEARRGGGSRSSFGRSRSSGSSMFKSKSKSNSSFGTKRSSSRLNRNSRTATTTKSTIPKTKQSSFGGSRLASKQAYTSKYGAPRKTSTYEGRNAAGQNQRYVMNNYGGYGSGLMTGYMMGSTSWMWAMPFHPAFYYSRPYYVNNPDGTIGVYPPTFSFAKLLFTLMVIGVIILIIRAIIKSRRRKLSGGGGFSSFS
jgi:hypothetical protein